MATGFERVDGERDRDALVAFLCDDIWPFHGEYEVDRAAAERFEVSSDDVDSYWVVDDVGRAGLLRLLDLGDIGDGAPQFDLRITSARRGRGLGTAASRWAASHLFSTYPELHRVEASTRGDNVAMQRALTAAGFVEEGRLRSSWPSPEGRWFDTVVYGILRHEWSPDADQAATMRWIGPAADTT